MNEARDAAPAESFCGHLIRESADGRCYLIFREGPFPSPRTEGFECARAESIDDAREVARLLFCGMRAEDIEVQMRDAKRSETSRERTRRTALEDPLQD